MNELNLNLQRQAKELAISNAELEQFAYVASHDLQEPLRMITGFLTQFEKKYAETIDDTGKKYIGFAVDGSKKMRQIIHDLLDFSRVGRTEDKIEKVDLQEIVNDISAIYSGQVLEKKIIINSDDLPALHTFKAPIRQVFQNLIDNGIKYQKPGQLPVIDICHIERDKYWEFSIKDNGIGINKEFFDKIFIIFKRLHDTEVYPGTGMGLAVTKKIIENMGGKIWVESEEGSGSTFYFTVLK
jgi:light-regulated signal transduction histidine kinase (bacteriophytochrome)